MEQYGDSWHDSLLLLLLDHSHRTPCLWVVVFLDKPPFSSWISHLIPPWHDMVDMKWSEGRTTIFRLKSKAYREREVIAAAAATVVETEAGAEAAGHPRLSGDGEKGGSEGDKAPTHEIV